MEETGDSSRVRHSLADVQVACAICMWLEVVHKHVDFNKCISAAVENLSRGHPLAPFGCSKCSATHLDAGYFAYKLHALYLC